MRFHVLCPVEGTVLMTVEAPEGVPPEQLIAAWTREFEDDNQTSWCPTCQAAVAFRADGKCTKRGTMVFHADVELEDEKGVASVRGPAKKLEELHKEHLNLGRAYPKPRKRKERRPGRGGVTVDGVHVPPGRVEVVRINGRVWHVDTTNGASIKEIKEDNRPR